MANRHKAKGDAFERELADYLNSHLFPNNPQVKRTPMSGACSVAYNSGMADLTGTPDLWVEAKRTETLKPHAFMAQAVNGTKAHHSADMPVVITRRNRQSMDDALVMLRLSDFVRLYAKWLASRGFTRPDTEQPLPQIPFDF